LVLVCEDLHWIDSETQALLDSLVESLPTAYVLLLINYRPEYQHGWGSKTSYTQVRLCVQRRLVCSVGGKPPRGRARAL
jgi:predicted ATPase